MRSVQPPCAIQMKLILKHFYFRTIRHVCLNVTGSGMSYLWKLILKLRINKKALNNWTWMLTAEMIQNSTLIISSMFGKWFI